MSRPSRQELLEALQESYAQLREHDREYHHLTPLTLLDKIRKLLEQEGLITPAEERKEP